MPRDLKNQQNPSYRRQKSRFRHFQLETPSGADLGPSRAPFWESFRPRDASTTAQERPKGLQDRPKSAQEASKTAPRAPRLLPGRLPDSQIQTYAPPTRFRELKVCGGTREASYNNRIGTG